MNRVLVIAEAGVNHNGSLSNAKKLIDAAADAGADMVKFQTFKSESLVSSTAPMASYQKIHDSSSSQLEMLRKFELSNDMHFELIDYCKIKGITFFSTAFDEQSVEFLASLDLGFWKVPSGEITNLPFLRKIGRYNKPTLLSTGMSTLDEVREAVFQLVQAGTERNRITILHCNTEYPTPMEDVNLNAMLTLRNEFGLPVGYSDHTLGVEVPIAAVALGATVIEKHFTLDRSMEGPDHRASLEPNELKMMISGIRNIELAFGSGIKAPSTSELKNIHVARKSVHLKSALTKGSTIQENHLVMKRPGDGISPMKLDLLIGNKVRFDLPKDHKLRFDDLL